MLHANIGQVTFFFPGRCSLTVHRSTARPTNESCTTWDPQCGEWFSWQEVDIATQIGKHLCKKCMSREWGPIFGSYISTLTQLTLEVDKISRFLQNFNCGVPGFLVVVSVCPKRQAMDFCNILMEIWCNPGLDSLVVVVFVFVAFTS